MSAPGLRPLLLAEGGLLASAVADPPAGDQAPEPASLAASGPRVADRREEIELAVAAIHEGYLLHYATGRVIDPGGDSDLALLAGDRLYAIGLERLAALGDVVAVAELADVIALCAQAHSAGDEDLAAAIWEAGAVAVGWGPTPSHRTAKEAARSADPGAAGALRATARAATL
jgi:hypothetical protein